MSTDPIPSRRRAALAGVLTAAAGAGVGELVAPLVAPEGSPFGSIGAVLIDAAPGWAKDLAVSLFWTADKIALLVGIGIVLLGIGAIAGLAERRLVWTGRVIAALLGIAGIAAALSREGATALAWLPSLVSGGPR